MGRMAKAIIGQTRSLTVVAGTQAVTSFVDIFLWDRVGE
jgi:hypothetical protein